MICYFRCFYEIWCQRFVDLNIFEIHLNIYFDIFQTNREKGINKLHRLRIQVFCVWKTVFFSSTRPPQTMGRIMEISIAGRKCLCVSREVVLWSKHFSFSVCTTYTQLLLSRSMVISFSANSGLYGGSSIRAPWNMVR